MSNSTDKKEVALQMTKEANPKVKNLRVDAIVDEFLEGSLAVVAYDDSDGTRNESLVYFVGDKVVHFSSNTELARYVGPHQRRSPWNLFVRSIASAGMPGLLAFVILIAICWLVLSHTGADGVKIPDILANALTVILGFYFGRHGGRT